MTQSNEQHQETSLVKVYFELDPADQRESASESVWARPLGNDRFRLENSPFLVYGYSFGDVVLGEVAGDGRMVVRGVSFRGGHSTYRLMLIEGLTIDAADFGAAWRDLETLGCTFEHASGRLLAVDVPPSTDADAVYSVLERGESDGIWEFEEGHCGHPLAPDDERR